MAGADCAPPALTPLNPRTDTTRRREHSHIALRPSDVTFDPSPTSAIVRIDRRWNKDWRHRDHSGHRIVTTASIVDIVHPGMGTGDAVSIGDSRRYPDLRAVCQEVRALPADTLVLTGATHGVDAAVREAALRTGLELRVNPPLQPVPGDGGCLLRQEQRPRRRRHPARLILGRHIDRDGSGHRPRAHVGQACRHPPARPRPSSRSTPGGPRTLSDQHR
jgi:hypothetical protein